YGRFLYPVGIFAALLAIPTFQRYIDGVRAASGATWLRVPVAVAGLFLFLNPAALTETLRNMHHQFTGQDDKYADSLMQKEYRAGLALAAYPDIRGVRIAFADAGVIPYFSNAPHLDVVGLNDRFIARERRLDKLVDYFFAQQPDLILHPG